MACKPSEAWVIKKQLHSSKGDTSMERTRVLL
jgi:hypothetical protein